MEYGAHGAHVARLAEQAPRLVLVMELRMEESAARQILMARPTLALALPRFQLAWKEILSLLLALPSILSAQIAQGRPQI